MRFVSLIPAVVAVFVGGAAYAQAWDVYVNRDELLFAQPARRADRDDRTLQDREGHDPDGEEVHGGGARGFASRRHLRADRGRLNNATGELGTAIEEAAARYRAMGKVTYDAVNMLDNHRSWRQTVGRRTQNASCTEILVARNNRLYISEATTALTAPPPAQFQASLQILDENGRAFARTGRVGTIR